MYMFSQMQFRNGLDISMTDSSPAEDLTQTDPCCKAAIGDVEPVSSYRFSNMKEGNILSCKLM